MSSTSNPQKPGYVIAPAGIGRVLASATTWQPPSKFYHTYAFRLISSLLLTLIVCAFACWLFGVTSWWLRLLGFAIGFALLVPLSFTTDNRDRCGFVGIEGIAICRGPFWYNGKPSRNRLSLYQFKDANWFADWDAESDYPDDTWKSRTRHSLKRLSSPKSSADHTNAYLSPERFVGCNEDVVKHFDGKLTAASRKAWIDYTLPTALYLMANTGRVRFAVLGGGHVVLMEDALTYEFRDGAVTKVVRLSTRLEPENPEEFPADHSLKTIANDQLLRELLYERRYPVRKLVQEELDKDAKALRDAHLSEDESPFRTVVSYSRELVWEAAKTLGIQLPQEISSLLPPLKKDSPLNSDALKAELDYLTHSSTIQTT